MNDLLSYRLLAVVVLALHAAIVVFVVGGLVLVIVGNLLGWQWVNALWFRLIHLGTIAVVAAEAWLGAACPLTTFEMWLRAMAQDTIFEGSFLEYWLQRFLYYEAPAWVFILTYSLFGLLVVAAWWHFPPQRRSHLK